MRTETGCPAVLEITESLRLRRFDGPCEFALGWYQDAETLRMVDGKEEPYTPERLRNMYRYLEERGELYWIEILRDGGWVPVGDVTLMKDDLPIVIGERSLRARGIGRAVLTALIARARALGWRELLVDEIYSWNLPSQKLFEGMGFRRWESTPRGARYRLSLQDPPEKEERR